MSDVQPEGATEEGQELHLRVEPPTELDLIRRDIASLQREVARLSPQIALVDFILSQRDWGYETFGPNYTGTLAHLKKEIAEVEAKPDDLEEWIDVILLGISGAVRSGGGRSAYEVAQALLAKYGKNLRRKWPDWREVPEGVAIEHDRTEEQKTAEEKTAEEKTAEVIGESLGIKPEDTGVCAHCGRPILRSTFSDLGYWEPDYDPENDPEVWRHATTGYGSCGSMKTFAEPKEETA